MSFYLLYSERVCVQLLKKKKLTFLSALFPLLALLLLLLSDAR